MWVPRFLFSFVFVVDFTFTMASQQNKNEAESMQQILRLVNNNELCIVSVFAFQSIFFLLSLLSHSFYSLSSIQCSPLFKFDFFSLPNQTSLFFTWIIRFFHFSFQSQAIKMLISLKTLFPFRSYSIASYVLVCG